ncbi:hypothetical protein DY000_02042346 [Brassica cretica]|uniref:Uncharacterized protein n=1 Tax=Brassica cretica TaxID=69181 RepID=A0ABQ7BA84_BRACR|nr:hypothetical protein DY000_02042346 [Brassica cretica]
MSHDSFRIPLYSLWLEERLQCGKQIKVNADDYRDRSEKALRIGKVVGFIIFVVCGLPVSGCGKEGPSDPSRGLNPACRGLLDLWTTGQC